MALNVGGETRLGRLIQELGREEMQLDVITNIPLRLAAASTRRVSPHCPAPSTNAAIISRESSSSSVVSRAIVSVASRQILSAALRTMLQPVSGFKHQREPTVARSRSISAALIHLSWQATALDMCTESVVCSFRELSADKPRLERDPHGKPKGPSEV